MKDRYNRYILPRETEDHGNHQDQQDDEEEMQDERLFTQAQDENATPKKSGANSKSSGKEEESQGEEEEDEEELLGTSTLRQKRKSPEEVLDMENATQRVTRARRVVENLAEEAD